MRISDWSSDVCSSDLQTCIALMNPSRAGAMRASLLARLTRAVGLACSGAGLSLSAFNCPGSGKGCGSGTISTGVGGSDTWNGEIRTAARRAWRERVSTFRSLWWAYHEKKKKKIDIK